MDLSNLTTIKTFVKTLFETARLRIVALILFGIFNSFFQGIGVVLIIPLLDIYQTGTNSSFLARFLYSFGWNGSLEWLLIFYFFVLFFYGVFKSLYTFESARLVNRFIKSYSMDGLHKIIHSRWQFYTINQPSKLTSIFHTEIGNIKMMTIYGFRIIQTFLIIVIHLFLSFWLSWQITCSTFIALVIIYFVQKRIVSKNISLGQKKVSYSEKAILYLNETFKGIKLVKIHSLEDHRLKIHEDNANMKFENDLKIARLEGVSDFYFITTGAALIVIIIYFTISYKIIPFGGLLILLALLFKAINHLQNLIKTLGQFLNLVPSFQYVNETLNDVDTHRINQMNNFLNNAIIDKIEFKNISFDFGEVPILKDRSFTFEKGKMYLFFGPSGNGKTTTLDLIAGLIKPDVGEVLINGEKVFSPLDILLQDKIGYVLQDTFLFKGSIFENICLGKNYPIEKVEHVIELAGLRKKIYSLPYGLETLIDENASMLSGGEKQRIAIARTLIKDVSILLLDEVTSSLDIHNEAHIMNTISTLKQDKIILLVGHREKLKDWADEVIYF
jgi:ABC-type multidrug transport system fused ATPase/permease subunit